MTPARSSARGAREAEVVPLPVRDSEPEERPVLVVDLGGQYAQLIARRIRECRVYSELVPATIGPDEVARRHARAVVLSGGPASVYAEGAPVVDPGIFSARRSHSRASATACS